MFAVGWVSVFVACFNPKPPLGAPCDEGSPCPDGQLCVARMCTVAPDPLGSDAGIGSGSDAGAGIDALPMAVDRDGDQVANDDDNCPDLANPDQGNEDGDLVGDVCDPCPIDVSAADPDGDGVAGSCDPRPNNGGDRIVAFDGFHRPPPDTWRLVGQQEQRDDALLLSTVANNHAAASPPVLSIANGTVTASVTVDATVGAFDSATTVMLPYDPESDEGVFCEIYSPEADSTNGRTVSLWDSAPEVERGVKSFAWSTATPYRLALTRNGNNYSCAATPPTGAAVVTTGSTTSM
ncbi:MAG: hypothetical protein H7138_11365, partial [Myxococcales bacterium]|nr:hypothetical protein [Myxococcales bacterium]